MTLSRDRARTADVVGRVLSFALLACTIASNARAQPAEATPPTDAGPSTPGATPSAEPSEGPPQIPSPPVTPQIVVSPAAPAPNVRLFPEPPLRMHLRWYLPSSNPSELVPTTSLPTQNASASTGTSQSVLPSGELPIGYFRIPRTDVVAHVGGYVKADFIHDFNGLIDSPDQFLTTAIPTNGSGVPNTYFNARATRLNLDVRWPNDFAHARLFVEIDFFTSSGAPRIRHAWAEVGRFRFGQDWTTFTNGALIPPTLDFENPIAYVIQRSPLVRYTQPLRRKGLELAISAEYLVPKLDTSVTTRAPGQLETRVPDFVGRFSVHKDRFDFSVHGVARTLWFQPDAAPRDVHFGWGFDLISAWRPVDRLSLYVQFVGGRGIASYRGFADLYVNSAGSVVTLPLFGGTGGFQVQWIPEQRLRSNFVVSVLRRLGDQGMSTVATRRTEYYAANLVWRVIRYFDLGAEYLYGINRDFGGAKGHDNRIQVSVYAYLP